MKKNTFYSSLLLSALFLAACNTTPEEVLETPASSEQLANDGEPTEPIEPTEQAPPIEKQPEPVVEETPAEQPVEESTPLVPINPATPPIISTSATLNYKISHPEGYTLAEEEPGKDMLFYNENDALSMRIEVFNSTDISFDAMIDATKQSMATISPNNTYESFDLAPYLSATKRPAIKASAGYIVQYESDKVTSIVYEIENKIIVLTIFDDYITGITDAFITAGLTIQ